MSRFSGLKKAVSPSVIESEVQTVVKKTRPRNPREGKRAVVGYFSPVVSKGLHQLALDTDTTIQGLIGEAIDDLMRKHGRHPFGER